MNPQENILNQNLQPQSVPLQNISGQTCKFCKNVIAQNVFFCPICGKKLKEPPLSTTIGKQLSIYALSLLLPPLGLVPAVKYLFSIEKQTRIIGIIALLLTLISTAVTIIYSVNLYNQVMNQFNSLQYLYY